LRSQKLGFCIDEYLAYPWQTRRYSLSDDVNMMWLLVCIVG
jgi:hypothetical protein